MVDDSDDSNALAVRAVDCVYPWNRSGTVHLYIILVK